MPWIWFSRQYAFQSICSGFQGRRTRSSGEIFSHGFADVLGFKDVAVMQDERQVLLEGLFAEAKLQAECSQRSPGGLQLLLSRKAGSIEGFL